jgi:hypothetical protein
MIEIPINDDYMNRAREKASTVGILQGSITGGTSNVVGAIGEISKQNFYKEATLYRKGDIDYNNGYTFKADCYNLQISQLSPCHDIKN